MAVLEGFGNDPDKFNFQGRCMASHYGTKRFIL